MKISSKGRYALRLMVDIAENAGKGCISIRDAAERQGISGKYLEQIVSQLTRAKLLRSVRGAKGGYTLTKPAEEYTAGEILRVIEGNLAPVACLVDDVNACERAQSCQTLGFWQGLQKAVDAYVDSVTLHDLLKSAQADSRRRAETAYLLD